MPARGGCRISNLLVHNVQCRLYYVWYLIWSAEGILAKCHLQKWQQFNRHSSHIFIQDIYGQHTNDGVDWGVGRSMLVLITDKNVGIVMQDIFLHRH